MPRDRTFSSREPLIWHDRPYRRSKEGDANCSTGILHSGTDFRETGRDTIAGVPVVKWQRGDGLHWKEEIYLAPSLDCVALRIEEIRRNRWYLPKFSHSVEAIAIEWGEPRPELFAIPAGYRQVEDPALPRLLRFVEQQRAWRR